MTDAQFRELLKQALERQVEIRDRQVEINAKLDALLERTTAAMAEALATHDAQLAEALREAEAEDFPPGNR